MWCLKKTAHFNSFTYHSLYYFAQQAIFDAHKAINYFLADRLKTETEVQVTLKQFEDTHKLTMDIYKRYLRDPE